MPFRAEVVSVLRGSRHPIAKDSTHLNATIDNIHTSSDKLVNLSENANKMVAGVSSGKGTVGALLTDREIYDDLKEVMKTIKQRPWKIVWKE